MPNWTWKLITSPYQEFDTTTPGLVNRRTILGGEGVGFDESMEIDLGTSGPFIPEILGLHNRLITSPRIRGSARTSRQLEDLMRLRIKIDFWTGAEWQKLLKANTTHRLVAFTPNWDPWTWWSSSFGNPVNDQGMAEIGDSPVSGYLQRAFRESWPSRFAGNNALVNAVLNQVPAPVKLTPGMIGHALLLESGGQQIANDSSKWAAPSPTGEILDAVGEDNKPGGTAAYIKLEASDVSSFPSVASQSADDYVASAWVRGKGSVKISVSGFDGSTSGTAVTLTDDWQLVHHQYTSTGSGGFTIAVIEASGSNAAMVHIGNPQFETGMFPTSHMESGLGVKNADKLLINDKLIPGNGLTFIFWYKTGPTTRTEDIFFSSWQDGSADRYIKKSGTTYSVRIAGTQVVTGTSTASANTWTQLAVILGIDTTGVFVRILEDGVQLSETAITTFVFPAGDSGVYIGSDQGLSTVNQLGLNHPLDSVRIDSREWTTLQILNDYQMKTDIGVAAFLAQVSGRLFRISSIPKGFGAEGVATGRIVGDLVLEESAHIPAGLVV